MERGFLKGKRACWHYGPNLTWSFDPDDIEECIRKRPWLVYPLAMPQSYYRSIAREEWDKDPWYGCKQAAPFLGITDHNAVHRYIRRGWLKAEKIPGGGGYHYLIRKSAIDAFLKDDPRPARYHANRSEAAKLRMAKRLAKLPDKLPV